MSCLEAGKQYKISAKIKIKDENGNDVSCNKNAEWFDPEYCPLFTIQVQTPTGIARLNLGDESSFYWNEGEWNVYNSIFTIDDRLSSATDAFIYIRGPRPGLNMYFDDISIEEYVGLDTSSNFWTSAPIPEGTSDNECVTQTVAESSTATSAVLVDNNIVYQYNTESIYDVASQCIVTNGNAEVRREYDFYLKNIFQ